MLKVWSVVHDLENLINNDHPRFLLGKVPEQYTPFLIAQGLSPKGIERDIVETKNLDPRIETRISPKAAANPEFNRLSKILIQDLKDAELADDKEQKRNADGDAKRKLAPTPKDYPTRVTRNNVFPK